MRTTQLQLNLWDDLEQATVAPETADIAQLWTELEQFIAGLSKELRLQTAGKAIEGFVAKIGLDTQPPHLVVALSSYSENLGHEPQLS